MIASGVTRETLERAAEQIGVRVEVEPLNQKDTRHKVKLYPRVPDTAWKVDAMRKRLCPACGRKGWPLEYTACGRRVMSCGDAVPHARLANFRRWEGERGDAPYQRTSAAVAYHEGRRVNAVCWHGFRDFFRAVFETHPDAVFKTAIATWRGSEHFEANYQESGWRNVGSQMAPVSACEVCRCKDSGLAN